MRIKYLLVAIMLVFGTIGVLATVVRVESEIPEGYRYFGPDRIDSDCVGDISTPECTADTYEACFTRADPSLCEKAGLVGIAFNFKPTEGFTLFNIDVLPITADRITPWLSDEPYYRLGNVEVRVKTYGCYPGEECPDSEDSPHRQVWFMAPVTGGWRLIGWADENGPVVCENEHPRNPYHRNCSLLVHHERLPWVFEYD